jgi:thymidylate synthase
MPRGPAPRARTIVANTGRDAVYQVCRALLSEGRHVSPRGKATLELSPVHIQIAEPADMLPTGIGRARLLPAIAAAEALQNIAGVACPGLMSRISSFFPKPTGRWGEGVETYGPRIDRQLDEVLHLLQADPDSREAVVSIWRAGDINGGQAHNLCTVALQFLVREGALDLHVTMRSNDAWYGLCYDLFQFAQVQLTLARCLDRPAGLYFHSAASMHLYARHWDAAAVLSLPDPRRRTELIDGLGWLGGQPWASARRRALALLAGESLGATPAEAWYATTLAPYAPDGS